ncbi:MAG: hypothetical protein MJY89_06650 [Bacteroidales bacterium]|nr:hypothetical protein [Bacteroidales bacterium]
MNRIFRMIVGLAAALMLMSCSKDVIEGKGDFYEARIEMNGTLAGEGAVLRFKSCTMYIEGFEPGESYLGAMIDGKADDYYFLDIRFRDINTVRADRKPGCAVNRCRL